MKKYLLAVALMLPLFAQAEGRTGVVDPIGALQEAKEFQDRFGKLESSLKDEQNRLDRLGGEVENLRGPNATTSILTLSSSLSPPEPLPASP